MSWNKTHLRQGTWMLGGSFLGSAKFMDSCPHFTALHHNSSCVALSTVQGMGQRPSTSVPRGVSFPGALIASVQTPYVRLSVAARIAWGQASWTDESVGGYDRLCSGLHWACEVWGETGELWIKPHLGKIFQVEIKGHQIQYLGDVCGLKETGVLGVKETSIVSQSPFSCSARQNPEFLLWTFPRFLCTRWGCVMK